MRKLFASGCTLKAYKPELISNVTEFLYKAGVIDGVYDNCCKLNKDIEEETVIISCCPGCNSIFGTIPNVNVISLWQVILNTNFPLPDYNGRKMTIHDACHNRGRNSSEMQNSVRELCKKMNIELIEPKYTRNETPCCGGCADNNEDRKQMAVSRAESLPLEDVVLYCTGCVRSFSVTDVHPYHILDLMFGESTKGLTI